MNKRSGSFTIAALTLGLCLVAAQAFAWNLRVINSSGNDLRVNCLTPATGTDPLLLNGATEDYFCDGTVSVQRPGNNPEYEIPNDCGSNEIKETTVTAGAAASATTLPALILAHQCVSAA